MKRLFGFVAMGMLIFPAMCLAQIKITSTAPSNMNDIPTETYCHNTWYSLGTVTVWETNKDDFPGSSGQSNCGFAIKIRVAPNLRVKTDSVTWDVTSGNQGDIDKQTCYTDNGIVTNITFDWDSYEGTNPYDNVTDKNVIILHVNGKNNVKLDNITIAGVAVQVLHGQSEPAPIGYLTVAGSLDACSLTNPYGPDCVIKNMLADKYYYAMLGTCTNQPPSPVIFPIPPAPVPLPYPNGGPECAVAMQSNTPEVVKMGWRYDPDNLQNFDFEEIIDGPPSPGHGAIYPTIFWQDCAGYFTATPPVGQTSRQITVHIKGVIPTLEFSTIARDIVSDKSNHADYGQLPLRDITVSIPGTYYFEAHPTAYTVVNTDPESNTFLVAKRGLGWTVHPYLESGGGTKPDVLPIVGEYTGTNPIVFVQHYHDGTLVKTLDDVPVDLYIDPLDPDNANSTLTGPTHRSTLTGKVTFSGLGITNWSISGDRSHFLGDLYAGVYTDFSTLTTDNRYYPNPIFGNLEANGLPVELTSFSASLRSQVVTLKWTTATESNNHGFAVQRSTDRTAWEEIGFVPGAGMSNSPRAYSFQNRLSEMDLATSTISYRLVQMDRDGKTTTSPVVTVAVAPVEGTVTLLQNYPNPFNPSTNIAFSLPEAGLVSLTVYNELGMEVARIHNAEQMEAGWHTSSFNAATLSSGLYTYRLQTAARTSTRTMIVAK